MVDIDVLANRYHSLVEDSSEGENLPLLQIGALIAIAEEMDTIYDILDRELSEANRVLAEIRDAIANQG